MLTVKSAVQELANRLPEDATWSEVQYRVVIRQKIEEGLEDISAEIGRASCRERVLR